MQIHTEYMRPALSLLETDAKSAELAPILEYELKKNAIHRIPIILGRGEDEKIHIDDMRDIHHLIAAGIQVDEFLDTQLFSMFYLTKPKDLKLVLIDPKFINLIHYNGVAHLACPVITEFPQIFETLERVEEQIRWRNLQFEEAGVRDIGGYNTWTKRQTNVPTLPYLLVLIHEVADLMMMDKARTEGFIKRIVREGLRVGMHLIVAARHPSVYSITDSMRKVVSARVALETEATFILNEKTSTLLPGFDEIEWILKREIHINRQEMRYRRNEHDDILRFQFPRLSANMGKYDEAFCNVVQTIREQNPQQYIDFFDV